MTAQESGQPEQSTANGPEDVSFVAFGGDDGAFMAKVPEDGASADGVDFIGFGDMPSDGAVSNADANVDAVAGIATVADLDTESGAGSVGEADEVEKGLAQIDPLTIHPRVSSCVLALVLALVCLASAAGIYWFGVHTLNGQSFDEIVWNGFAGSMPGWLVAISRMLSNRLVIPIISLALALIAFVVAAVRKRWWLVGQMAVFGVVAYGASWLKRLLPRPFLMNITSSRSNTAPSGHTLLAVACGLALLVAVPRVWRAVVALVESVYVILVAASLVVGHWHRPSDVLMSLLIGGGLVMLTLVFTRKSGMDSPGSRVSSASIQIVGSVMITFGVVSCIYAAYLLWQIYPGLAMSAAWAKNGACTLTMAAIIGVTCLMFGLTLALRQLTASPLTRLGLVGAPPAPPEE